VFDGGLQQKQTRPTEAVVREPAESEIAVDVGAPQCGLQVERDGIAERADRLHTNGNRAIAAARRGRTPVIGPRGRAVVWRVALGAASIDLVERKLVQQVGRPPRE